jgi:hypothetical protein
LAHLIRLRLAAYVLEVDELGNRRMGVDVVAAAGAMQLEAEPFDEVLQVSELDVRDGATREPGTTFCMAIST